VEGFDAALDRAEAYLEAGADMLFIEAPQSTEEIERIVQRFASRVPLMANMVEGGKTPIIDAAGLENLGFSFVIFPGGIVRAIAATARDYYSNLVTSGSNESFRNRMFDFAGINRLIGTAEMLATGKRYDGDPNE